VSFVVLLFCSIGGLVVTYQVQATCKGTKSYLVCDQAIFALRNAIGFSVVSNCRTHVFKRQGGCTGTRTCSPTDLIRCFWLF